MQSKKSTFDTKRSTEFTPHKNFDLPISMSEADLKPSYSQTMKTEGELTYDIDSSQHRKTEKAMATGAQGGWASSSPNSSYTKFNQAAPINMT